MDELKKCPNPWCYVTPEMGPRLVWKLHNHALVECESCGLEGPAFSSAIIDEGDGEVIGYQDAESLAVTAWNTRPPVTDEMVERAVKALEPFAKAAMGIKAFDPDFPLDGAALRASFDWYDKCQGEALKRNSVRLHDINFAAETHVALTAALGGPHG